MEELPSCTNVLILSAIRVLPHARIGGIVTHSLLVHIHQVVSKTDKWYHPANTLLADPLRLLWSGWLDLDLRQEFVTLVSIAIEQLGHCRFGSILARCRLFNWHFRRRHCELLGRLQTGREKREEQNIVLLLGKLGNSPLGAKVAHSFVITHLHTIALRCSLSACFQAGLQVASSLATPRMDCDMSQNYAQWIFSAVAGTRSCSQLAWGSIS